MLSPALYPELMPRPTPESPPQWFLALAVPAVAVMVLMLVAAPPALLLQKISQRRNWGRVVLLCLTAGEAALRVPHIDNVLQQTPLLGGIDLLTTSVEIVATVLLFGRASNAWFNSVAVSR